MVAEIHFKLRSSIWWSVLFVNFNNWAIAWWIGAASLLNKGLWFLHFKHCSVFVLVGELVACNRDLALASAGGKMLLIAHSLELLKDRVKSAWKSHLWNPELLDHVERVRITTAGVYPGGESSDDGDTCLFLPGVLAVALLALPLHGTKRWGVTKWWGPRGSLLMVFFCHQWDVFLHLL